jgi:hypothetical protein
MPYKHFYPAGQEQIWGNQQGNDKKNSAPPMIVPAFRHTSADSKSGGAARHPL